MLDCFVLKRFILTLLQKKEHFKQTKVNFQVNANIGCMLTNDLWIKEIFLCNQTSELISK